MGWSERDEARRMGSRGLAYAGNVARKRTLILLRSGTGPDGGMLALGSLREVCTALGQSNVHPDGSGPHGFGERVGTGVMFGPGMVLEIPFTDDPGSNRGQGPELKQILVSVTDEDFAFPVLMRICRLNEWKMMDPDSGRTFG